MNANEAGVLWSNLNSREEAILIWLLIGLIFILCKKEIREPFLALIKHLSHRAIIIPVLLLLSYMSGALFILSLTALWTPLQIKNLLAWFLTVALVTLFKISSIKNRAKFFKGLIKSNIEAVAILEFIISLHSFSLPVELTIIPIIALLSVLLSIGKAEDRHKAVAQAIEFILFVWGCILIASSIKYIALNPSSLFNHENFVDFYTPPLLSVFLIPFLYATSIFIHYENAFTKLNFLIPSASLLRYSKLKAVLHFGLNTTALEFWLSRIGHIRPQTRQEIRRSILETKEDRRLSINPPDVPFSTGWSPHLARYFLSPKSLTTRDYHPFSDEEWFASSPYLELEKSGIFKNNVAYYIEGTKTAVYTLKLVLNVNNISEATRAKEQFIELCKDLVAKAISTNAVAVLEKENFFTKSIGELRYYESIVEIKKDDWTGGIVEGGHSLRFSIKNGNAR